MKPTTAPSVHSEMTVIERFFQLREVKPFDRLYDSELALIAEATVQRTYAPGQRLLSANKMLKALFITIEGRLEDSDGQPMPRVFSPEYLLMAIPAEKDVRVSTDRAATCLLISKGHFFTILYECPALALGFSELPGPGHDGSTDRDQLL